MKKILNLMAVILELFNFFSGSARSRVIFDRHVIDANFKQAAGVFAGDVDGDGDIDVICAGASNGIAWWRNEGGPSISWTRFIIDPLLSGAMSAYAIDVDGDNDLDVLAAAWFGNSIVCYQNNGGQPIQWKKQTIAANFTNAHEVFACDVDADGDADVFGVSAGLNQVAWWRNDGGIPTIWVKQVIDNNIQGARSIFVADFDGDGDQDAVAAGFTSNEVSWYRNDGNAPIQWTKFTVSNTFAGSHRVYACDLDCDGDQDILGVAYSINQIAWWRNNGGNPIAWTKQVIDGQLPGALVAHAADLDGDGDMDVAGTANIGDDLAWYRNDGGWPIAWKKTMLDDNFDGAWPVYLCDIDGDGDLDILAGADIANDLVWWENVNVFLQPNFGARPNTGHAPATIQFYDSSSARPQVRSWQWDFNNDGTTEAWEQNPSWTFDRPGDYSIRLTVSNDSLIRTVIQENYLRIFDGESALEFDGRNSYVSCPAVPSLSLEHMVTIEAWIKPDGWGSQSNIGSGRIMDKKNISLFLNGEGGALNPHSLVIWLATVGGTAGYLNTPENSVCLNQWQHIALTYDGNLNTVQVYLDGVKQTLHQVSGQLNGAILDNSHLDLRIGNSTNRMAFAGVMDEIRLWSIVRSAEEIQTFMNCYLNANEAGLVGYWQMNEGTGAITRDKSANGNHGVVTDARWIKGILLNPVLVDESATLNSPKSCVLSANYPNPFNAHTTIRFALPVSSQVQLAIYNATGELVTTLVQGKIVAGTHAVRWNGTKHDGETVSSGIYFCKITTKEFSETQKMLLLK